MKKIFFVLLIASTTATAQNYQDSTITITATQRLAWWVAKAIELNWENRKTPDALRLAFGSGAKHIQSICN